MVFVKVLSKFQVLHETFEPSLAAPTRRERETHTGTHTHTHTHTIPYQKGILGLRVFVSGFWV
jgi:hypothetical protein